MSDLFNQAVNAATSAANTAVNTATSLANQATTLATNAANSETAANVTAQAKTLGAQGVSAAGSLAGQAHAQAHAFAPGIVPAPGTGTTTAGGEVDTRGDLSPTDEVGKAKFEKLFEQRAAADELQEKGKPGDALAGKKAELQKAITKDALDKEIAQRPPPDELVKKGILQPGDAPLHQ
nr:uncharacterized protein CI109_001668 [Kwoniella shandongensis]KAA5529729.1 hypothetical protein CI109_001668 [Kwoniella shandongensis]